MPNIPEKKLNRYRRIFQKCDTDGDNLISIRELKAYLRLKGHEESDLPKDQIIYIFKAANKDGSKKLNFEEFVEFLEHPDLQFLFGRFVNKYVNFLVPQRKPEESLPRPHVVPKGRSVRVSYQAKTLDEESTTPVGLQRRLSATSAEVSLLVYSSEEVKEQDLDYIDQFTCCPPPLAMFLISLLELAFFLADEITQKGSTLDGSGVTATVFMYEPNKRHEAWRYLTYMFVHIGHVHIVVNLIFQLLLGIPLEMVHGWWRVILLYFAGVIAGSLTTSITDPWVRLAGASGGVYCLLTAHIATIIMNWKEMTLPFVQILIFGVVVVCDLGSSIYDRYFLNANDQIGYAAHFGGAVAGLLVGIYLLKNLRMTNCEKYLWWAAVVTYVVLMLICVILNIALPDRYPPRVS